MSVEELGKREMRIAIEKAIACSFNSAIDACTSIVRTSDLLNGSESKAILIAFAALRRPEAP